MTICEFGFHKFHFQNLQFLPKKLTEPMSQTDNFFSEFPTISKQEWIERATKDLKGADFNEKLVWKTEEGLEIMPFYTKEDLESLAYLKSFQNSNANTEETHLGARNWLSTQQIEVENWKQANEQALLALQNGADGVCFDLRNVEGKVDFKILLKDVLFPYCQVNFIIPCGMYGFLSEFEQYFESRGYSPNELHGSLQIENPTETEQKELAGNTQIYPNFRSIVLSHSDSEKISDKISELLFELDKRFRSLSENKIKPTEFFQKLQLNYSISNNYFFEIASLRALRMLVLGMSAEYGASNPQVFIHANTTTRPDKSNPETNMISNTTQAMSGILGGCDSLSVTPHNTGVAKISDFSQRIARNVSNLLREESYFDKVADPVAGSYYIETLTHQLAKQAWEQFRQSIK
ncbi:MAG: methylmalonyl-CoA mutase [Arenicella sp.]|jgi:methylmalonyl-CoA mutase